MKLITAILLCAIIPIASFAQNAQHADASQKAAPPAQQTDGKDTQAPVATPSPKIDPVKEEVIRKLFAVMKMEDLAQQTFKTITNSMRPLLESSFPPGAYRDKLIDLFFQKFQSKFSAQQLLDLIIPVYDQHFTKEDIEELTQFYQTPLGKRVLTTLPQVVSESQAAGQKMGEKLGRDSMLEVLAEHPELMKALEDAAAAAKKP